MHSGLCVVCFSVCLLVCWLPYISVSLYETFTGQQSPAGTSALSAWLVLTSTALNPWITCLMQTYVNLQTHALYVLNVTPPQQKNMFVMFSGCERRARLCVQQVQGRGESEYLQVYSDVPVFWDSSRVPAPESHSQSHQHDNDIGNTSTVNPKNTNTAVIDTADTTTATSDVFLQPSERNRVQRC